MISKQLSGPPKPASASATIGANQSRLAPPSLCSIWSARCERAVDPPRQFGAGVGRDRATGRDTWRRRCWRRRRPASRTDRSPSSPARTCCIAWLPVTAPSARTGSSRLQQFPQPQRPAPGQRYARPGPSRAAVRRRPACRAARSRRTGRTGRGRIGQNLSLPVLRAGNGCVRSADIQHASRSERIGNKCAFVTN